jgi:hypothetical protein
MADSFNSVPMWMYLLELLSDSAEKNTIFNSSEASFRDVGMFSLSEWQLLVSRTLSEYLKSLSRNVV